MSTDEIRHAFHTAFEPVVGGVVVDPALSHVVRRRYAREQRLLTFGGVVGVAVVTAGTGVAAVALHTSDGRPDTAVAHDGGSPTSRPTPTPSPTPTPQSWQTVTLVGHDLTLPGDWTLSGNRRLVDLDTFEPAQPIGGQDQSVTARSPDGTRRFKATVYSGPIADAERSGNSAEGSPDFTPVTINGLVARIHVSGPADTCLVPATDKQSGTSYTIGPCPTPDPPDALYGEARYSFADGDFMMVDTFGMDAETLADFLTTALSD
jgi:hypothetical protein